MSTPPGHKDLWRNIGWKNEEEKLAFFNHYFIKSKIVSDLVVKSTESFRNGLIEFIKEGKIKEGNKERDITKQDIINKINKT